MKSGKTTLLLTVIILISGIFCCSGYTFAGTGAAEQSRKKKNTVNTKTISGTSFGQAYREAKKKGAKTFKWNGKSYTTEKKTPGSNTSASNKTAKKETSASYKNVSFGKAYSDAKKKGIKLFTWNGKSFTTGVVSNKKTTVKSNKNITSKKKNVTSKKKSFTSKKKNVTSKKKNLARRKNTPKRTYTSRTYNSPGVYTPPSTYGNSNTGARDFKRETTAPPNENFRKEPKKD